MKVQIDPSWQVVLQTEFDKPYFAEVTRFIKTEIDAGKIIYPKGKDIFNAFNLTPFSEVKVVIIGQDPYHGANQAHGLSFSVLDGVKPPPSLANIFKELKTDVGLQMQPNVGNLSSWAKQGVLLLNSVLTVRDGEPASHAKLGWQYFTDAVIQKISFEKENIIFLLWGKYAQQKEALINTNYHFVLKAAHPSPFSADKGFFGCKHFSMCNEILLKLGKQPIDWALKPL